MKIHDRPWPCVILRARRGYKPLFEAFDSVCHQQFEHLAAEDRELLSESLKYFECNYVGFRVPAGLQIEDIEFRDRIPPVCRIEEGEAVISYPIYFQKVKVLGQLCLSVMAPYHRVLSLVVRALAFRLPFDFLTVRGNEFASFLEGTFGRATEQQVRITQGDFRDVSIRVKAAILPLKATNIAKRDNELRRVLLTGDNIFRTRLYQRLRSGKADGNSYQLSGAKVTLLYSDDLGKGVGTSVSQYGAYSFRPGFGGENMEEFRRLIEFLALQDVLHFEKGDPLDHQTEEVLDD